jgi:hypothetical protein
MHLRARESEAGRSAASGAVTAADEPRPDDPLLAAEREREAQLDEALIGTFPASDPIALANRRRTT